jgi:CHAT domain-containing protein
MLIATGLLYRDLGSAQEKMRDPLLLRALQVLQEAASVAEPLGDARSASYALGHAGHLYETEHRYEEALALTRRAIFAAQTASAPESLYRWQWQAGRLLAATGKLDEAIASYRTAAATLQPIRPEVASSGQASDASAGEPTKPLFFELSNLLLQRAALTDDGKIAEDYLRGARDAVEAFKAAELRDYFRDECVDALLARLTKLDTLSKTTAVIYPIIFPDRTDLLVSLPTGLKRVSVEVSATQLTQEIRSFRRKLETRTTREYLLHAQQLYDWMLRSLEPDFATHKIDTLVFVPDGPLRTIPMAALHDGKQFLIKKFAVATTPGLNLTDPRPLDREKVKLLAGGLTESTQGYPPLPHVKRELQSIHTMYGGDQLVNKDFVIIGLEKELKERPVSILHIASHGRFEKDVAHSFVLAYDDKLTMERLDEFIGLFKFRQEPLELLILSACETAVGDDRAALGLAGIAIKAGARSALATLWSINDQASSDLITEFYQQLREPGVSKAVALQRAQVKMLSDLAYEHPAYWSPFLLLNNWL